MPFCVIPSIFDVVETLRPVLLVAPTGSQSFSLSTSQECASISSIPQNRAGTENREIRGCLLHAAVARFLVGILKLDREERGTFHNAFEKGICIMFLTAGALLILLAAVQVAVHGGGAVGSLPQRQRSLPCTQGFSQEEYSIAVDEELREGQALLTGTEVRGRIQAVIAETFDLDPSLLYLTKPTFFSRINSTLAKTQHDEYWHPHIDKVTYGSFDYTSLLYLSDYGTDFTGGRFIFMDSNGNRTVEPRAGTSPYNVKQFKI
ncbi:unnamed protein product [Oncorhynchus mykiss]|uniref:Prolyl 4-hydroxylase alpha subunit domain-containing protein n=1 Tax=Oncorhynchus mykiss TaxID=8022 RepID=A0A060YBX3_ONCMY|nr:unnamed protein product [Oncorhynchus mykiss]